jgi:hypothetical protein
VAGQPINATPTITSIAKTEIADQASADSMASSLPLRWTDCPAPWLRRD